MIPGGKGIAFLEKKAVFLPLVVPGDRIRIRQVADRGSYLEVLDSELVQASPDRQQPPCPYFGRCGGCDFQQMNPRRQLDSKAEILTDALHHVGRIRGAESRIVLNPSPVTVYRNRLQLKVLSRNGKVSWGFFERASHRVVEIDRCRIATDALWAILPDLQAFLERSPMTLACLTEVEIFQGDEQESLIDLKLKPGTDNLSLFKRDLLAGRFDWGSRTVSLYLSRSQKRTLRVLGPGFVHKTVGEWKFRVSRGSFFQVNDFMLESLSQRATQGPGGSRALDLFCGVGFFTLPLATKFDQVWAVDQNAAAILDIESNARANRCRNCRIFHRDLDTLPAGPPPGSGGGRSGSAGPPAKRNPQDHRRKGRRPQGSPGRLCLLRPLDPGQGSGDFSGSGLRAGIPGNRGPVSPKPPPGGYRPTETNRPLMANRGNQDDRGSGGGVATLKSMEQGIGHNGARRAGQCRGQQRFGGKKTASSMRNQVH